MKAFIFIAIAVGLVQARPQVVSSECPPSGHHLLAHEYDCTKFYYCEYGLKDVVSEDCAPGTEFSYDLQVCVHPMLANCNLSGVPPTVEPETETPMAASTEAVTDVPTETPSPVTPDVPTNSSTVTSTEASTDVPTNSTTAVPTNSTTDASTEATTLVPINSTTDASTEVPINSTTEASTEATTDVPTNSTTAVPTNSTTNASTEATTIVPTNSTTDASTEVPINSTTVSSTEATTDIPTNSSTDASTDIPTNSTTEAITNAPTEVPTDTSTDTPTEAPVTEASDLLPNGCPADFSVQQMLPHEADCNKFYICNFGEKVLSECAAGTHFNPTYQVCDWPEFAGCVNSSNGNNGENGNGSEDNGNENNGESSTEPPVDGVLSNGCPSDFSLYKLLPHETECDQFYYCDFGEKVVRDCAPGTHFNPNLEVCDWPENAGCANFGNGNSGEGSGNGGEGSGDDGEGSGDGGESSGSGSGDNGNGGEGSGNENNGESSTVAPVDGLLPNGCPSDFSVHKLLPHETECDQFYYCNFGEKLVRDCAPGTHFNPNLQVCDWPENAGCASSGNGNGGEDNGSGDNGEDILTTSAPIEAESTTNSTTVESVNATTSAPEATETPLTTSAPVTEENENLLPNGCPADFSSYQLLPHETECNLFYSCNFGDKVVQGCPSGTHFNPSLQVCDWPENAGCASSSNGNGGEDNGNGGEDNGNSGKEISTTFAPIEAESTTNSTTVESVNVTTSAPEATETPLTTSAPVTEENENLLPNGCPADFSSHQLMPHETECNLFYYCNFGEKVVQGCPSGTHFNPSLQVCDWPENAGCASSGNGNGGEEILTTSAPIEAESTTNSTVSESVNVTTSAPEATESPLTTSAPVTEENQNLLPNGCPADFSSHQLLPHETECNLFYSCNFGEKVVQGCPSGTHFNPSLQVCDWPENAGCANSGNGNGGEDNGSGDGNGSGGEDNGNGGEDNGNGIDNGNGGEDDGNSATEEEIHDAKCAGSCNVLPWAHETDCDKFWRCDGEKSAQVICAEGLHFNANSLTCDFICNANCVRDHAQTTLQNDGVRIFLPWHNVDEGMVENFIKSTAHTQH